MLCGQVFRSPEGLLFDHVPLSCVPPWTSAGFDGLIATLINCNVLRLRSVCAIRFGTRESMRPQFARLKVLRRPRSFELHREDKSPKLPSVRITPPSEPSKIWVGFDGLTTIEC